MIYPKNTVMPFYQWMNNNGYCGEVSLIQAGMNQGQWMSQYHARLVCGTGLLQSGPEGWCKAHGQHANFNAQLLLETRNTGVTGQGTFGSAGLCLANARLKASTYPYQKGNKAANLGIQGTKDYLRWIKQETILGHQVTIGVLMQGGDDPQYDHIVSVMAIGTRHAINDPAYYDDDVLYFDDHGLYTLDRSGKEGSNPAVPLGATPDSGCTPYVYAYAFSTIAKSRALANQKGALAYAIVVPGTSVKTFKGGNGASYLPGTVTAHNYGFSVSAALDQSRGGPFLKPVRLSIVSPTVSNGQPNPKDPIAGWQYENSMIGQSVRGESCTNSRPQYPMNPVTFQVTISELVPGTSYNIYEYDFNSITGKGSAAALPVPVADFNRNAARATQKTTLVATEDHHVFEVKRPSNQIVVFRVVPATAP